MSGRKSVLKRGTNSRWRGALHKQVLIAHDGRSAEVDEGIAALVLALWRRGFQTFASCESWATMRGYAYVSFETEQEHESFQRIAESVKSAGLFIATPDEEIRAKIAHDPTYAADVAAKGGVWMVGFPPADIPAILEQVETTA